MPNPFRHTHALPITRRIRYTQTGRLYACRALLLCALFTVLSLHPVPGLAQTDTAYLSDAEFMALVREKRTQEFALQRQEVGTTLLAINTMAEPLAQEISRIQNKLRGLQALYRLSRNHPTEMLNIVQQLNVLQVQLDARLAQLRATAAFTATRSQELHELKSTLSTDETELPGGRAYLNELNATLGALGQLGTRTDRLLAPGEALGTRLRQTLDTVQTELPDVWRSFYFAEAGNPLNPQLWKSLPSALAEWLAAIPARMGFAWPQSGESWLHAGILFAVALCIIMGAGLWAGQKAVRAFPRWANLSRALARRVVPWIAAGCALIVASANREGGSYLIFSLAGVLLLIWSTLLFTWKLRRAVGPGIPKNSPLSPLFAPAALGVIFLYTDLPPQLLGAVWILVMLAMIGVATHLYHLHEAAAFAPGTGPDFDKNGEACGTAWQPLPKDATGRARARCNGQHGYGGRWLLRLTTSVCLASAVCTLSGYTRLAIPVFMLFFALAVFFELGYALSQFATRLARRIWGRKEESPAGNIFNILAKPVGWVLATVCLLPWLWAVPGARYLISYTTSVERSVGDASFSFSRLLWIIGLFFLVRVLVSLARIAVRQLPQRFPSFEQGAVPPIQALVKYAFWALFFIAVLGILGVNLTSLAVVAGGLSVGIGLGMQNLVNNFISGLMLLFGRTVLVGDVVQLNGTWGVIKKINTRATELETYEHGILHVPNSDLLNGNLVNWSRGGRIIRRELLVGIAYGSDVVQAMKSLADIAGAHPHVLKDPGPSIYFDDFAASSLTIRMLLHIDDVDRQSSTLTDLRLSINERFAELGIEIAFPQLDVRVYEVPTPES